MLKGLFKALSISFKFSLILSLALSKSFLLALFESSSLALSKSLSYNKYSRSSLRLFNKCFNYLEGFEEYLGDSKLSRLN